MKARASLYKVIYQSRSAVVVMKVRLAKYLYTAVQNHLQIPAGIQHQLNAAGYSTTQTLHFVNQKHRLRYIKYHLHKL